MLNPARVTQRIDAGEAHDLSRTPGIGLMFREPYDAAFAAAVEALLRRARASVAMSISRCRSCTC